MLVGLTSATILQGYLGLTGYMDAVASADCFCFVAVSIVDPVLYLRQASLRSHVMHPTLYVMAGWTTVVAGAAQLTGGLSLEHTVFQASLPLVTALVIGIAMKLTDRRKAKQQRYWGIGGRCSMSDCHMYLRGIAK